MKRVVSLLALSLVVVASAPATSYSQDLVKRAV